MRVQTLVLARAGTRAFDSGGATCATSWEELLEFLERHDTATDELRHRVARLRAGMEGSTLPDPPMDNSMLNARGQRNDLDWPVHSFRTNLQFGANAASLLACVGCGAAVESTELFRDSEAGRALRVSAAKNGKRVVGTWRKAPKTSRARRADENPAMLDISAELAAEHGFAAEVFDRIGVGIGAVQRVLSWPAMSGGDRRSRVQPDLLALGTAGLLAIEAKRPGLRKAADSLAHLSASVLREVAREFLVRVWSALETRRILSLPQQTPIRVLALGDEFHEDGRALLVDAVWQRFEGDESEVRDWKSKGKKHRTLGDAKDPTSRSIREGGVAFLHEVIRACTWERLDVALRSAAGAAAMPPEHPANHLRARLEGMAEVRRASK